MLLTVSGPVDQPVALLDSTDLSVHGRLQARGTAPLILLGSLTCVGLAGCQRAWCVLGWVTGPLYVGFLIPHGLLQASLNGSWAGSEGEQKPHKASGHVGLPAGTPLFGPIQLPKANHRQAHIHKTGELMSLWDKPQVVFLTLQTQ